MNRAPLAIWTLLTACLISCPSTNTATAQTIEANVADLQDQLESGLRCRRPEEFAFVKKVVTMVGNDQLPLELVISTFQWTRKNPRAREYPFFYFQRALRERAKKLGITV